MGTLREHAVIYGARVARTPHGKRPDRCPRRGLMVFDIKCQGGRATLDSGNRLSWA